MATILIATKNARHQVWLRRILAADGHAVRAVGGVAWGCAPWDDSRPDLLLVDLDVLRLGGVPGAFALRRWLAGTPVIATVDAMRAADPMLADVASALGPTRILVRPYPEARMLQLVRENLEAEESAEIGPWCPQGRPRLKEEGTAAFTSRGALGRPNPGNAGDDQDGFHERIRQHRI